MINFRKIDFAELDLILYIIHNFYNATSYKLTPAIVTQLKMNAFMNKLNKRASVKNISQVDIFIVTSFFV